MIPLLALLFSPALAALPDIPEIPEVPEVPDPVEDCSSDDCTERRCRRERGDPGYAAIRADYVPIGPLHTWGGTFRTKGRRDGWLGVEGRWAEDGGHMARAGLGLDLFGRSSFDLGLGLVAGNLGVWQTGTTRHFAVGTELVVGFSPGRFLLEHRHLGGRRPGGGLLTESHTRIGFRPTPKLELAIDLRAIDPGFSRQTGVGLGAGLRF